MPSGAASAEIAEYRASVAGRMRLLVEAVRNVDRETLNARPYEGANSPFALAEHAAGNARAWILGIACGYGIVRDRPGEFAASGDAATLVAVLEHIAEEVDRALAAIDPGRLDARLIPDKVLWGEGEPHAITVRRAIVQVIEHASLHLGHLHTTLEWLRARR